MQTIEFSKYHGLGNDFILIDQRRDSSCERLLTKNKSFISNLCDRNFGIGADGVIFILNSNNNSKVRMKIINSDSTESEMCGNGIRCLIKYLIDEDSGNGLHSQQISVETLAGTILAKYHSNELIEVDMGLPSLEPETIPTTLPLSSKGIPTANVDIGTQRYEIYSVGMGNPHLITFPTNFYEIDYTKIGTMLEVNKYFPNKTNVHFVKVIDKNNIEMVVWERGAGLTLACGTGACASVVASSVLKLTESDVTVKLPGGLLNISWPSYQSSVYMKGPASLIFKGSFDLNKFL